MSIAIIRRFQPPQPAQPGALGIPNEVISTLVQRAATAGKVISLRTCCLQSEALDCLRSANDANFEFVIFDPGEWTGGSEQLQQTLKQLKMHYIEVHDDRPGALEHPLPSGCGPRLSLAQGHCSQSYTLALSMALEHLGCAECENDIHVGT